MPKGDKTALNLIGVRDSLYEEVVHPLHHPVEDCGGVVGGPVMGRRQRWRVAVGPKAEWGCQWLAIKGLVVAASPVKHPHEKPEALHEIPDVTFKERGDHPDPTHGGGADFRKHEQLEGRALHGFFTSFAMDRLQKETVLFFSHR